MSCERPDLQDQWLLARARGEECAADEARAHLAQCDNCRAALEMTERMRAHWQGELSHAELLQLRMRVLPRLSGRPVAAAKRQRRAVLIAGLLGAAIAGSAAAAVTYYTIGNTQASEPATSASPTPLKKKHKARQTPVVQVSAPPAIEAPAPPSVTAISPKAQHKREPVVSAQGQAGGGALWSEAADALKRNDRPRAERALAALADSRDAVTRDSAELTLIELWMKSGQAQRGRATLARLSTSGATPAIRARARKLAHELEQVTE